MFGKKDNNENSGDTNAVTNNETEKVYNAIPEFVPDPLYRKITGTVVSSLDKYCFIGNVRRGYATENTNGDVFYHAPFPIGTIVEISRLEKDPEREGRWRAVSAWEIQEEESMVMVVRSEHFELSLPQLVQHFAQNKIDKHKQIKNIPEEDVNQSAANFPFYDLLTRPDALPEASDERFLKSTYSALDPIGVNFSMENGTEGDAAENEKINEFIAGCGKDFAGQAQSVKDQYAEFKGVREIFRVMREHSIIAKQSIIPFANMAEVLMMAPVWYVDAKKDLPDNRDEQNPRPDRATEFFTNMVGSQEFANLYQIYNRRNRRISTFAGRDLMPPSIMKIAKIARETFDFTVVATPYHDVASTEWANPKWLRLIDPFLFGFSKNLPFAVLLGRWSGTGLFPLTLEMIADTVNHLRTNKNLLSRFASNSYWYHTSAEGGPFLEAGNGSNPNKVLEPFADKLIAAYEEGNLFPFLRGEAPKAKA